MTTVVKTEDIETPFDALQEKLARLTEKSTSADVLKVCGEVFLQLGKEPENSYEEIGANKCFATMNAMIGNFGGLRKDPNVKEWYDIAITNLMEKGQNTSIKTAVAAARKTIVAASNVPA